MEINSLFSGLTGSSSTSSSQKNTGSASDLLTSLAGTTSSAADTATSAGSSALGAINNAIGTVPGVSSSSSSSSTDSSTDSTPTGFDLVLTQVMQQAMSGTTGLLSSTTTAASAVASSNAGGQAVSLLGGSLVSGLTMAMLPTSTSSTKDASKESGLHMFANGNTPSLADFVDVVNPLQHIPIVDRYYQKWTGDTQGYVPQMLGSTLYGGAFGAMASIASVGATQALGENPVDYVTDKIMGTDSKTQTASTASTAVTNKSKS
ncbi:hypothetical protein [Gallaecimonas mangrovi]|uniref:hypothetical protein n=1 Tax=Gallaecimonas mangrovi TaxID=2291597 RepID=UPI000E202AFD|nr:hypothetical protein [Gallaecimonas mangrovi]